MKRRLLYGLLALGLLVMAGLTHSTTSHVASGTQTPAAPQQPYEY